MASRERIWVEQIDTFPRPPGLGSLEFRIGSGLANIITRFTVRQRWINETLEGGAGLVAIYSSKPQLTDFMFRLFPNNVSCRPFKTRTERNGT